MMAGLSTAVIPIEKVQREGARDDVETFKLHQHELLLENFARLVALGVRMVCGTDAGVRDTPFEETWREHALMVGAGLAPVDPFAPRAHVQRKPLNSRTMSAG